MRTTVVAALASLLVMGAVAGPASASQQPAAPGTPVDPAACTVAPLDEFVLQAYATGVTTGVVLNPDPTLSQDDIERQVTATVEQSVACVNANQPLAWLALFSADYLAWLLGPENPDTLGDLQAAISRTPVPAEPADRLSLVLVGDVTMQADGRVTAIVVTANEETTFTDRLTFVLGPDGWLIDAVETGDALPTTPVGG